MKHQGLEDRAAFFRSIVDGMVVSHPTARLSCFVANISCVILCRLMSHLAIKCFISPSFW